MSKKDQWANDWWTQNKASTTTEAWKAGFDYAVQLLWDSDVATDRTVAERLTDLAADRYNGQRTAGTTTDHATV